MALLASISWLIQGWNLEAAMGPDYHAQVRKQRYCTTLDDSQSLQTHALVTGKRLSRGKRTV